MKEKKTNIRGIVVFLVFSAIIAFSILNWRSIYDWWRLRGYDPPEEIEAITKKTTMTNDSKRYFYVAHPQVTSQKTFNEKCRSGNLAEFSIILGCYISTDGIYIYKVKDPRLDGIIEVTGAHEMLHSAYERLSTSERNNVNTMLEDAYSRINNKRIRDSITQYKKNDPSSVYNELHSILGTEVRDLPASLENYYKQYFNDRSKVVDLSDQYESEFNSRQSAANQIKQRLESLKTEIDQKQVTLKGQNTDIQTKKAELDRLLADGNTEEYNSRVDEYNQTINEYNALVNNVRELISEYNSLVERYKQVAFELNDLYQSIDSRPSKL